MHVDDGLPIGDAHLVEDGIAQETGVVDDRVDTTELLDGLFDDRCRTGRIGDGFAIGMRDSAGSPDTLDDGSGRTGLRSEGSRVGKECVRTCSIWWWPEP